jgi:hypothetical protein
MTMTASAGAASVQFDFSVSRLEGSDYFRVTVASSQPENLVEQVDKKAFVCSERCFSISGGQSLRFDCQTSKFEEVCVVDNVKFFNTAGCPSR